MEAETCSSSVNRFFFGFMETVLCPEVMREYCCIGVFHLFSTGSHTADITCRS